MTHGLIDAVPLFEVVSSVSFYITRIYWFEVSVNLWLFVHSAKWHVNYDQQLLQVFFFKFYAVLKLINIWLYMWNTLLHYIIIYRVLGWTENDYCLSFSIGCWYISNRIASAECLDQIDDFLLLQFTVLNFLYRCKEFTNLRNVIEPNPESWESILNFIKSTVWLD